MNMLYLKYAVEVADCGSMNKAADKLYVAQPNISRAIKELERELGVTVFERNKKGMTLTPDGEKLVSYGRAILRRIDEVENAFKRGGEVRATFSLSATKADYISEAFAAFCKDYADGLCETTYEESGAAKTINDVCSRGFGLGIVRYAVKHNKYFKDVLESKGLTAELVAEFNCVLVTAADGDYAELGDKPLSDGVEVVLADGDELASSGESRRMVVVDRAARLETLASRKDSYAWSSPLPQAALDRYGLIQSERGGGEAFKDVVIYKKGYVLTEFDKAFITELCRSKRRNVSPTA